MVWELELGAPAEIEASPIEWVVGQPCTPGSAWPAMVYNGRCVGGLYSFDLATVVEARDGFPAFSSTAFTHELVHAFLFKTTGDQDGGHARPEWSHVASGNDALAAAGL